MSMDLEHNLCAVIGNPIAHSLSPEIHANFAQQFDMSLRYDKLLATDETFSQVVKDFFAAGGRGLNITTPFKEKAFQMCASTCQLSRRAKSCNTLYIDEGQLVGTTTDGLGWLQDIERLGFKFADARILLIGAGGASRILIHSLLAQYDHLRFSDIVWSNRSIDKLVAQVDHERITKVGLSDIPASDYDLIINGLSVGWQNAYPELDIPLQPDALIYDLNYGSGAQPFHDWALTHGAGQDRLVDGWGMLVNQAAASFNIWWNKQPETTALIESGVIAH